MFYEIGERAAVTALYDLYPPAADRKAWEEIPEDYREPQPL